MSSKLPPHFIKTFLKTTKNKNRKKLNFIDFFFFNFIFYFLSTSRVYVSMIHLRIEKKNDQLRVFWRKRKNFSLALRASLFLFFIFTYESSLDKKKFILFLFLSPRKMKFNLSSGTLSFSYYYLLFFLTRDAYLIANNWWLIAVRRKINWNWLFKRDAMMMMMKLPMEGERNCCGRQLRRNWRKYSEVGMWSLSVKKEKIVVGRWKWFLFLKEKIFFISINWMDTDLGWKVNDLLLIDCFSFWFVFGKTICLLWSDFELNLLLFLIWIGFLLILLIIHKVIREIVEF